MRLVQRIVRNRAVAEELIQDTYLNVISRGSNNGSGIAQPEHYLARAARNLALNHVRHLRHGVEVEVKEETRGMIPDTAPSPERICLYRGELRYLLSVLAQLTPRRRQVFALHKFEGLSYDEIAGELGISRNTVMVQMVNALTDLDRRLDVDFHRFV
jgi:RNA polymerase sigma-70 factor (ECF subfamily)